MHIPWYLYFYLLLLPSKQWRAKSLDDYSRSSSSSNLKMNTPKNPQQPFHNLKSNIKDLQQPLTISVDCYPPSPAVMSRGFRINTLPSTATSTTGGGRGTPTSLHVPGGNVIKANGGCTHSQRRLSKR